MGQDGDQPAKTNLVAAVVAPLIIAVLGFCVGLFYQKAKSPQPVPGGIKEFTATTVSAEIIMTNAGSCYQIVAPAGSGVVTGFPWMNEPQGSPAGDMIQWTALDAAGNPADLVITFPSATAGKLGTPFFDGAGNPINKLTIPKGSTTTFGPTGAAGNQIYGDYYFSSVTVGGKACSNTIISNTGLLGVAPLGVHVDK